MEVEQVTSVARKDHSSLLSFADDSLLAIVLSACEVKELGRLACVARRLSAKSFCGVAAEDRWSLIEEAARVKSAAFPATVQALAPPRTTQTWLQVAASLCALTKPIVSRDLVAQHGRVIRSCAPPHSLDHLAGTVGIRILDPHIWEHLGTAWGTAPRVPEFKEELVAPAGVFGQHYVELEFEISDGSEGFFFDTKVYVSLAPAQSTDMGFRLHLCGTHFDDVHHEETERGMLTHVPGEDSIWADMGCVDGESGQWRESNIEDEHEYRESIWLETEMGGSAWPVVTQNDKVGLLWDADAGNLAVFLNGHRQGFANGKRWMGEIKGNLCWKVLIVQYFEKEHVHPDAEIDFAPPSGKVNFIRRPVPTLSAAESRAERNELAEMAKLKRQREAEVANLLEKVAAKSVEIEAKRKALELVVRQFKSMPNDK